MNDVDFNEPSARILTDAESHREIVEFIAERRSAEEAREYPRFPTADALCGEFGRSEPSGLVVCTDLPVLESGSLPQTPEVPPDPLRNGQPQSYEIISGFWVVDFSEGGMQIQMQCDNPLKYIDKQLYLKINDTAIPVSFIWFKEYGQSFRGGVSFLTELDQNPILARFLVKLCDRLVYFLTNHYSADHISQHKEIAIFTYFCILYNLRFRFIEALSFFMQSKKCLESLIDFNESNNDAKKILNEYSYSKYYQFLNSKKMYGTPQFTNIFNTLIRAYYECGCAVSGSEGKILFLEKDIVNIIFNCVLFFEWNSDYNKKSTGKIKTLHGHFMYLKKILKTVFQSDEFERQFGYYHYLIDSILLSRETIIDSMSNTSMAIE